MEQKSVTKILDLNDDCLGAIFKYLGKHDQAVLGILCERFASAFKLHCKKEHSVFILKQRASFDKYFQLAGSLIKCISEKIRYMGQRFDESFLKNLLKSAKSLHSLAFYDCPLDDDDIEAIADLSSIDELYIKSNYLVTGKFLYRLEKLKLLSLGGCWSLESKYLTKISMEQLETLNLKDSENVTAECIHNLTKRCQNLNQLFFSCNAADNQQMYMDLLMHLPNLKQLGVNKCTTNFLKALAENELDQLEKLTLIYGYAYVYGEYDYRNIITKYPNLKELSISGCRSDIEVFIPLKNLEKICLENCSVAAAGIINMLQMCPKLVYISIEDNRSKIGEALLSEAINLLHNRKRPVKLRLQIEGLTNDYLQTSEYCANKHILQLELLVREEDYDDYDYDINSRDVDFYCGSD